MGLFSQLRCVACILYGPQHKGEGNFGAMRMDPSQATGYGMRMNLHAGEASRVAAFTPGGHQRQSIVPNFNVDFEEHCYFVRWCRNPQQPVQPLRTSAVQNSDMSVEDLGFQLPIMLLEILAAFVLLKRVINKQCWC